MNSPIEWDDDILPENLGQYGQTSSKCGEWRVARVPGGYLYTQWRQITEKTFRGDLYYTWQPYATTFVPTGESE